MGLVNPREIRHLWKHEPVDRLPMVVTFAGTVTLSLEWAILLGLATAWVSRRLAGPETGVGACGEATRPRTTYFTVAGRSCLIPAARRPASHGPGLIQYRVRQ